MANQIKKIKLRYVILGIFIFGIILLGIKYKYEHAFSTYR